MPQKNSEGQDREGEDYDFVVPTGGEICLKYCYKCREDLPISEFHGNSYKYDLISDRCKKCSMEYKKEYHQRPETKLYRSQYEKKYRKENREKIYKYDTKRNQNPERKEYKKKYMKEYMKEYRLRKKLMVDNKINNGLTIS